MNKWKNISHVQTSGRTDMKEFVEVPPPLRRWDRLQNSLWRRKRPSTGTAMLDRWEWMAPNKNEAKLAESYTILHILFLHSTIRQPYWNLANRSGTHASINSTTAQCYCMLADYSVTCFAAIMFGTLCRRFVQHVRSISAVTEAGRAVSFSNILKSPTFRSNYGESLPSSTVVCNAHSQLAKQNVRSLISVCLFTFADNCLYKCNVQPWWKYVFLVFSLNLCSKFKFKVSSNQY